MQYPKARENVSAFFYQLQGPPEKEGVSLIAAADPY
jgi:hypothetical protein